MSGTTSGTTTGLPPLTGYVEDPPGSGHWVPAGGTSGTSGSVPASGGGSSGGGSMGVWPASTPVAIPTAGFTFTVYASGLVGFRNTSIGLISAYLWTFGDGTTSNSPNPLHQYIGSGTFKAELRVANSSGQSSDSQNVVISAVPIVETVNFTYVVGALGVQFTDASTKAGERNWDFGDGTTSSETSPYKLYTTPGIYTVTLTITGVSKSYQLSVDVGIVLQWQDNSSDETGFKIERSPDGVTGWALIATVGAGVTTLTVTQNIHGVDPAVENHFRVYAYNGDGNSGYTNIVQTQCGA